MISRGSSLRLIAWPTQGGGGSVDGAHDGFGGGQHRLDDVVVAGAAAEVARERLADLLLGRRRVALQQVGRSHDHARRAVAALQPVVLPERLLERMQRALLAHSLDRLDLGAVRLDGEQRARLDRLTVEVDRARAAVGRVAADVRAGEAERFTQEVDQEQAGFDVGALLSTIDGHRDPYGTSHASPPSRELGGSYCARGERALLPGAAAVIREGQLGQDQPILGLDLDEAQRDVGVGHADGLGGGLISRLACTSPITTSCRSASR